MDWRKLLLDSTFLKNCYDFAVRLLYDFWVKNNEWNKNLFEVEIEDQLFREAATTLQERFKKTSNRKQSS